MLATPKNQLTPVNILWKASKETRDKTTKLCAEEAKLECHWAWMSRQSCAHIPDLLVTHCLVIKWQLLSGKKEQLSSSKASSNTPPLESRLTKTSLQSLIFLSCSWTFMGITAESKRHHKEIMQTSQFPCPIYLEPPRLYPAQLAPTCLLSLTKCWVRAGTVHLQPPESGAGHPFRCLHDWIQLSS